MNFDHILLLGHGAPAQADEVMPYLRSMSGGRSSSEERLKAVAGHYELIGGASPYNIQVSDFKARLAKELCAARISIPVFMGMKNWHPFLKDILPEIYQKGFRKGVVIPLTPYRSASSGAGYHESLKSFIAAPGMKDLSYQFIEGWQRQELFIEAEAEEVSHAFEAIDPAERAGTPVLFTFHSLPASSDSANPVSSYEKEARAASALVATRLGHKKWKVVFQSRPVSAKKPWLGPEIEAESSVLAAKGEKKVLIVPLGFLCDHAEILYDLDHAVRARVEKAGMKYLRAKTVLQHPKIVTLVRTMIQGIMDAS